MFTSKSIARILGITGALLVAAAPPEAGAVASNTSVSNQATVNYQVGGVSQTAINSNSVAFVVDKKVNLTVSTTDGAVVQVSPNATLRVLTFSVQNTGNDVQDFHLTSTEVATAAATKWDSATDAFNVTSYVIRVESGATAGYQAGEDTATYIDELAAASSKTVYIVSTIPAGATNGQYASHHLLAEARVGGSGGAEGVALTATGDGVADTAGSVDIVFADAQGSDTANDAARDAKHSSQDDYKVVTANLTVTKSSAVISDGVSASNFKRIPGAVVEYTVQISNAAGVGTATNITLSDSLNTEITDGDIAFNTQRTSTAGSGIWVVHPDDGTGGAGAEYTNANDGVVNGITVDWNVTGANTATVSGITLDASESATVKFRVTIQ